MNKTMLMSQSEKLEDDKVFSALARSGVGINILNSAMSGLKTGFKKLGKARHDNKESNKFGGESARNKDYSHSKELKPREKDADGNYAVDNKTAHAKSAYELTESTQKGKKYYGKN